MEKFINPNIVNNQAGTAIIIEIDEYKKLISGYKPEEAHKFHSQSARMADKDFDKALRMMDYNRVVLMCGGSASGKSEYVSSALTNLPVIVYDGTLATQEGLTVKIRNISKANKTCEVHAIIPNDLVKVFDVFIRRERKIPAQVFYDTHSGARSNILWLAEQSNNITLNIFESYFIKSGLKMKPRVFSNQLSMINYLKGIQKTPDDIRQIINDYNNYYEKR